MPTKFGSSSCYRLRSATWRFPIYVPPSHFWSQDESRCPKAWTHEHRAVAVIGIAIDKLCSTTSRHLPESWDLIHFTFSLTLGLSCGAPSSSLHSTSAGYDWALNDYGVTVVGTKPSRNWCCTVMGAKRPLQSRIQPELNLNVTQEKAQSSAPSDFRGRVEGIAIPHGVQTITE